MCLDGHTKPPHPTDEGRAWLLRFRATAETQQKRRTSLEARWSGARLGSFLAALILWYPLELGLEQAVGFSLLFLGMFAFSVSHHRIARSGRMHSDRLLLILDESLRRCGGRVTLIRDHRRPPDPEDPLRNQESLVDDGPTWQLSEQECGDLDLYSPPVGLFGLLNRTSTVLGARRLRDMMERLCLSSSYVEARQAAVRALETRSAERLTSMAEAGALRGLDASLERLVTAIQGAEPLSDSKAMALLRPWSILSGCATMVALVEMGMGRVGWGYLAVAMLLVNGGIYAKLRRTLNNKLAPWKGVVPAAQGYLLAARRAGIDLPEDGILGQLRAPLSEVTAATALPALCNRATWAESGGMMHELCNVLFLFDLHVTAAILKPVLRHRELMLSGLSALADLEALMSLACFAFESAGDRLVCYPAMSADVGITMTNGRHPLVPPRRCVPNSIELDGNARMWVVTGPNMGGKSTFLRMCGLNCLLAQMGTAVLADRMSLSPVRIMSDLQVRDDLADEESYFLAEVRQLGRMVSDGDAEHPMLGLMDEPFRGTNSAEQVAASLAVVEHLLAGTGLFIVATHELRLSRFADRHEGVTNRHFHERLEKQGMVFDYRLRSGPARQRNALLVLEREGYPPALLLRARHWLASEGESPSAQTAP